MVEDRTTYGVFVSGVVGPVGDFADRLVDEGMSEGVVAEVIRSMPCFVKRDVPLEIAQRYKTVFERAGAWVMLENWQTTTNPAAHQGFVDRPREEEASPAPEPEPPPVVAPARLPVLAAPSRVGRMAPGAIAVGLLLILGSYVYGCARITQKQGAFNDELNDLNRVLENYNARGVEVTTPLIVEEVQALAARAGVSVDEREVVVLADPIRVERHPYGGCVVEHWPDSVRFLSRFSHQRLMQLRQSCAVPRWIIGVRVNTVVRWGLASQRLEFEHYTPVLRYDELD